MPTSAVCTWSTRTSARRTSAKQTSAWRISLGRTSRRRTSLRRTSLGLTSKERTSNGRDSTRPFLATLTWRTQSLDKCIHNGPSLIDHRTFGKSWPLPESFLRGCGLPDDLISYLPSLLTDGAIQFYSCFISYSHADKSFARRLHDTLQGRDYGAGWMKTSSCPATTSTTEWMRAYAFGTRCLSAVRRIR